MGTAPAAGSGSFLGDDFLLSTPLASRLFHEVARGEPIVDVHNHLSADDIVRDRTWATLTDVWLGEDHYKWRAMRQAGVPEELVSGGADPWDRFAAWAATMPRLLRNPLYAWSHLELRRAFGIDLVLGPDTAREIWDEANRRLPTLTAQGLLRGFAAEVLATTNEPWEDLAAHRAAAAGATPGIAVVPTFRPDPAHALLGDPAAWNAWVDRLVAAGDASAIEDLPSLRDALAASWRRFAAAGCRASDHGLAALPDRPRDPALADATVRAARAGRPADDAGREAVLLEVLVLAAELAHADDAVLQVHLGALRNASPRLLGLVGRDAGADVMGDERQAGGLAHFLGGLERDGTLPRTVIYNLNPADNELFATMAGAFARPGVPGVVQWGPAWWFNDHEVGIRRQLDALTATGSLGGALGMLTDSRAILSMTRHELFRRILCDVLARDAEAGLVPADPALLGATVRAVSGANARSFFGFAG